VDVQKRTRSGNGRAIDFVDLAAPIRNYLDTLVHPAAGGDALTAARHRAFIAPRLLGSFVALATFPVYIALRGAPGALEVLVFAWLIIPIMTAYFLSRTGMYETAHLLSAFALATLGTAVAAVTGGIASFATAWLIIVPLEAAFSASRRVIAMASTLTFGAVGLLLLLGTDGLLPIPQSSGTALAALAIISATLYATALAIGAQGLAQSVFGLVKDQTERYRLLAANMTDAITRHDQNGAVLFASPAAEPLFGAPSQELIGNGLFDRVHVADRPAFLTALGDAAAFGHTRTIEFRVRRETAAPARSVEFIWVEMRCQPHGHQGREVIAVVRDITERMQLHQTIENAQSELAQAGAARNKSLAVMSHELCTPLNAIVGFSQMLSNENQIHLDSARRNEYVRLIGESGTHLLSLVNDILDISKFESGDFEIAPESFAPGPLIGSCCDLLAIEVRAAGLDLAMRLDESLPSLIADKRAFKQIMINLLSNAVKFTDRGGRITVSAKADRSTLAVIIEDNGIGVSADILPRLGDPFFRVHATGDRQREGSGLGLSIVKGLIVRHGGKFEIASHVGRGTRVCVRLPLDCRAARPLAAEQKGAQHQMTDRVVGAASNIRVKKSA
jgi:two-component system, cell cycle sensor histidine kinase DivJ